MVDPSVCVVAKVPTNPLSVLTTLKEPVPVIGPIVVVPRPTALTLTNSLSTFKTSPGKIEEIPEIPKYVVPTEIEPPLLLSV